VFAAGDVANAWHPTLGVRVRVEHWATALNQPRTVAATITGQHAPYDALPYFFSDQYDVGLEYTGRTDPRLPSEVVVRGDAGAGSYTAFWLQEARVVAAMSVNTWGQTDTLEALIRARRPVPTTALADEHVPLESLVGVPAEATG
jgi:3-phenylpropionate/trans-cinnamate dioxygenase ferredoxin reductase subunit